MILINGYRSIFEIYNALKEKSNFPVELDFVYNFIKQLELHHLVEWREY